MHSRVADVVPADPIRTIDLWTGWDATMDTLKSTAIGNRGGERPFRQEPLEFAVSAISRWAGYGLMAAVMVGIAIVLF